MGTRFSVCEGAGGLRAATVSRPGPTDSALIRCGEAATNIRPPPPSGPRAKATASLGGHPATFPPKSLICAGFAPTQPAIPPSSGGDSPSATVPPGPTSTPWLLAVVAAVLALGTVSSPSPGPGCQAAAPAKAAIGESRSTPRPGVSGVPGWAATPAPAPKPPLKPLSLKGT
jgi:hypothetical protein